jgi:Domain of unknown function (DUF4116)
MTEPDIRKMLFLKLIRENPHEARFLDIDKNYLSDKSFILESVYWCPSLIECADSAIQRDSDVLRSVLPRYGYFLQHTPAEIRSDPNLVMSAIQNYPFAYRYASPELRENAEIAAAAVKGDMRAWSLVPIELRNDKAFALDAVASHGELFKKLSPELRADRDVTRAAICRLPSMLRFSAVSLQKDPEMLAVAREASAKAALSRS